MQTFEQFWDDVATYKLETKHPYYLYKEGFECGDANGCGAKGGVNVPDTMWGVRVSAACNIHDIDWKNSTSYTDLVDANMAFRRNLEKILDEESANKLTLWLRLNRMSRYYRMVKLVGTDVYAKERGFVYV